MWELTIPGRPRPKGSMKCLGGRSHHLVEEVEGSTPWKLHMIREIRKAFDIVPIKSGNRILGWERGGEGWEPFAGAVTVTVHFLFGRKADWASHRTLYPTADDFGDTDKLCRNLGDALEQSGLIKNDSQIVNWYAGKAWGKPCAWFRMEEA